jgi:inner membrane protein
MDPLTHTAVGLFLSRAGLSRLTPRAAPILMLAANAPDIDAVTAAGGSVSYLHYHRHLTHSLIAMPVMAILTVLLVRFAGRKPVRWLGAFAVALGGVASHLLLDLMNPYGIRLFLPFSADWLRLDIVSVVDLWIWAACLLAVAGPFLSRLVGSEIGAKNVRPRHHGRGFAIAALAFVLVYECGRGVLHARAVALLEAREYQEAVPVRTAALPDPVNPFRWRGLVETAEFYAVADVNVNGEFEPSRAAVYGKPEPNPAIDAARGTKTFREFLRFSQSVFWRVSPPSAPDEATLVEAVDMRFGTPRDPGFMASATVDSANRVLKTAFTFGKLRVR